MAMIQYCRIPAWSYFCLVTNQLFFPNVKFPFFPVCYLVPEKQGIGYILNNTFTIFHLFLLIIYLHFEYRRSERSINYQLEIQNPFFHSLSLNSLKIKAETDCYGNIFGGLNMIIFYTFSIYFANLVFHHNLTKST